MVNFQDVNLTEVTDFAELKAWSITHKDVLGKDVLILDAAITTFETGDAYICNIFVVDEALNLNTDAVKCLMGAKAIVSQLTQFAENLPILAQVSDYTDKKYGKLSYKLIGASEQAKIMLDVAINSANHQSELPF